MLELLVYGDDKGFDLFMEELILSLCGLYLLFELIYVKVFIIVIFVFFIKFCFFNLSFDCEIDIFIFSVFID